MKGVRASTADAPPATSTRRASSTFSDLLVCSEDDVRRVIMSSPTKSCTLDPIPTDLLKELVDILLPYLTAMINTWLHEGYLPTCISEDHHHAAVEEVVAGRQRAQELQTGVQSVVPLEFRHQQRCGKEEGSSNFRRKTAVSKEKHLSLPPCRNECTRKCCQKMSCTADIHKQFWAQSHDSRQMWLFHHIV